jgi:putative ATPase
LTEEAQEWIASHHEGDARRTLNFLDQLALIVQNQAASGSQSLSSHPLSIEELKKIVSDELGMTHLSYDRTGDEHYQVISAFIKSLRGSDPHAGLYYLARMIEGGEDPVFIARRLVIFASEDVGNADPRALQIALHVKEALSFVGMPEGRIPLAQAVTYLALAPKSNASYIGIDEALAEVRESGALPVPLHLRNAVSELLKTEGFGKDYQYAHSYSQGIIQQQHLPDSLTGRRFYRPKSIGLEIQLKEKLDRLNPNFESQKS